MIELRKFPPCPSFQTTVQPRLQFGGNLCPLGSLMTRCGVLISCEKSREITDLGGQGTCPDNNNKNPEWQKRWGGGEKSSQNLGESRRSPEASVNPVTVISYLPRVQYTYLIILIYFRKLFSSINFKTDIICDTLINYCHV